MRAIIILKNVLDWMFIMSIFGIFGYPLLIFLETNINISNYTINLTTLSGKIVAFFAYISYILFVYLLFIFRKTAFLFLKVKIFDENIIKNIYLMGIILISVTILTEVPVFVYKVYETDVVKTTVYFRINNGFFNIAVGLFFIIVSRVFKITKKMKEDNDLTI